MKRTMTNLIGSGLIATTLGLGGCTPSTITIDQVQNAAVTICSFLPTATTVANILANGNATIDTAGSIAAAICAAVTAAPKSARLRAASPPVVNGVIVQGTFVRGQFVR